MLCMGYLQVFSIIYSRVTAQDSDGLTAEAIEIQMIQKAHLGFGHGE
jgi:hypothetical protein